MICVSVKVTLTPVIAKYMVRIVSENKENVSSARNFEILMIKADPSIFSPLSLVADPAMAVAKKVLT